jgi:hypothetical protein
MPGCLPTSAARKCKRLPAVQRRFLPAGRSIQNEAED